MSENRENRYTRVAKFATDTTAIVAMLSIFLSWGMVATGQVEKILVKIVRTEMAPVTNYIYNQQVKNIVKQYLKIEKDPGDIKNSDIEQAIDDWQTLPDDYKTASLRLKMKKVEGYFEG